MKYTDAQDKILNDEIKIENTNLYKILYELKNEEIILWYSCEYIDDLSKIKIFDELIEEIKESLQSGFGEIYVHYKNNGIN
jgi:peroxiredoxin family protein